jgi:hypothetical protein
LLSSYNWEMFILSLLHKFYFESNVKCHKIEYVIRLARLYGEGRMLELSGVVGTRTWKAFLQRLTANR